MIGNKKADRPKVKPIVFKDGVRVDMSSMNEQWIDGDILEEEMNYISRMTEGLATGTMTGDKEYIYLKNKVVKDMISDKVISLKKRLCKMAKQKNDIYDHAEIIQDKALQRIQNYAKQIAKDNKTAIYLDELTGEYKISNNPVPISLRHSNDNYLGRWHVMDIKQIEKEIADREEAIKEIKKITKQTDDADEKILKEVEAKLKAQDKSVLQKKVLKEAKKKKYFT